MAKETTPNARKMAQELTKRPQVITIYTSLLSPSPTPKAASIQRRKETGGKSAA